MWKMLIYLGQKLRRCMIESPPRSHPKMDIVLTSPSITRIRTPCELQFARDLVSEEALMATYASPRFGSFHYIVVINLNINYSYVFSYWSCRASKVSVWLVGRKLKPKLIIVISNSKCEWGNRRGTFPSLKI